MKGIFRFGKTRRVQYVSHLDLQRFMQMALRRTALPVAYTQGFNPHPILSFASALAMGWTSEYELMEIRFSADVPADKLQQEMSRALPPDIPLYSVRIVEDQHPAMMSKLECARYTIALDDPCAVKIASEVPLFLAETEVDALRKTKSGEKMVNIRPWCYELSVKETESGMEFDVLLKLTEAATLKPDLLMKTLAQRAGTELPGYYRIHRTCLYGRSHKDSLTELMRL